MTAVRAPTSGVGSGTFGAAIAGIASENIIATVNKSAKNLLLIVKNPPK
jgi:hypothetical protein